MQHDRGARRGLVRFPTDLRPRWWHFLAAARPPGQADSALAIYGLAWASPALPPANENGEPDGFPPLDFGLTPVSDIVPDSSVWPDESAEPEKMEKS